MARRPAAPRLRITLDTKPRPAAGVFAHVLDGEITLYDEATDHVRLLNPSGSVIWELCDGARTVRDIIGDVAAVYEIPPGEVEADVIRMLSEFADNSLIADAGPAAT